MIYFQFCNVELATIFMLHRVSNLDANRLPPNENMKISPQYLDKLITDLKNSKYEFISLDELSFNLSNDIKRKKQVVFTLDDGYKDNYEIAYPIFKKHNVPFTIYVTTSFPNKTAILWWYILEDLILNNNIIYLSDGTYYNSRNREEKIDAFLKIRKKILRLKKNNFISQLNILFDFYKINWFEASESLCMNWSQIIKLSKDDLVTIGGHTINHFALNQLTTEEVIEEVVNANVLIESKIGKKIKHFAYPFGSQNEIGNREVNIIKSLNFKTATTTRNGKIFLKHKDFLDCLPRIFLNENFRIKDLYKFKFNKFKTL